MATKNSLDHKGEKILRIFRFADIHAKMKPCVEEALIMRQTLIVSTRGQITLPADIRKRFGIKSGEPVIIEDRNGELVLKPATVLAVEMYSPKQVAEWDQQDQLSDAKRKAVLDRLSKRAPKVAKKRS